MRRNRGLTVVELLAAAAIAAAAAAFLIPAAGRAMERARESARKATCLSNVKSLAMCSIMYASDYDDVLPACVPDDLDGTAHPAASAYKNWKVADFQRDVVRKYGEKYLDGRWMRQLGDALLWSPGPPVTKDSRGYLSTSGELNCPTLVRADPRFLFQAYHVGTDKQTGMADPHDPLLGHLPAGTPKTWQSGSYVYLCMHHPFGAGVRASDYGPGVLSLWDVGNLLGYIGKPGVLDAVNPRDYLPCGLSLGAFDDPGNKPLVMCRSFGVHEGCRLDYARQHVIPTELAPVFGLTARDVTPTMLVATPVGFIDGHAKYVKLGYYDILALVLAPNTLVPRGHHYWPPAGIYPGADRVKARERYRARSARGAEKYAAEAYNAPGAAGKPPVRR